MSRLMRYFRINTLADVGSGDYCFSDRTPRGIATRWYRLATGVALAKDYPANPDEVTLQLGDDFPGLKLPSFLGNTSNMLVVLQSVADLILSQRVGHTERLPFVLLDHQGRVHSHDYVFLNPLERVACLDLAQSQVRRSKKGEIKDVHRAVLDPSRIEGALDLFRLAEEPNVYLFSVALVQRLQDAGACNFVFAEVELAAP